MSQSFHLYLINADSGNANLVRREVGAFMIPCFPKFRPLGLDVSNDYYKFTAQYPCYSEFNFIDLYAWDLEDTVEISMLNQNLVVKRADYLSRRVSLSFLGSRRVKKTVETLLDYAEQLTGEAVLESVPEVGLPQQLTLEMRVQEERNNADYILDLAAQVTLPGSRFSDRRTKYRRFMRNYGSRTSHRLLDPADTETHQLIWALFDRWARHHNKQVADVADERAALQRLLQNCSGFNLQIVGVFDRS